MKTKQSLVRALLLIVVIAVSPVVWSQTSFNVAPTGDLKISGTSSLHDWEMTSKTASGKAVMTAVEQEVTDIKSLTVEMEAESLKSGKKAMDKNTYKALQTDVHKKIKFELNNAAKLANGNWNLTGTFTIAGTTKKVTIPAKIASKGNIHTVSGSYSFKLTDYNITPPTALMGTIKTGNDVKISFQIDLK